ncbi:hypothetical protein ACIBBE_32135 [Streptomyces sp. NPDC051644]|uniref:hypothetical protein n=1 Tax=Streptomyces sp. NPDC051644 TaxID=3365666 RepID=UPI0037B41DBD
MSFPPLGRDSGAAHHDYCTAGRCCRCQQRPWTTRMDDERLCGPCAACCRECGRAPAPHLDGLDGGLCLDCRGLCGRCRSPQPPEGGCPCRKWRERAGNDPVGYVLQAFPQPLMQALGHRLPPALPELIHQELTRRSADQLLDRLERRWNLRWAHALHEKGEDGRHRWSAQEIAEQLLRPGSCSNPQCEDGCLVTTDTACTHCRRPEHRFVPSVADRAATSDHARATAAEIRRAMLDHRDRGRRHGGRSGPVHG